MPTEPELLSTDPKAGAAGEAHLSAAMPNTALPTDLATLTASHTISPHAREMLNTPLVHPTGIDMIDSLTSPVNLALGTIMEGPTAVKLVSGAVKGLTEHVGAGLAGKILKFALPSVLKKPAELADILTEFGKLGEKTPAAAPAAPPVAVAAPPAPPVAAAPVAAPVAPVAAPAAFNPSQAMGTVRDVFKTIKVTPAPAEVSNAASLMRHGKTAEEAVARVLEQRPGVDLKAAAKLAEKLGLPSDATVASRVAARNSSGRWEP